MCPFYLHFYKRETSKSSLLCCLFLRLTLEKNHLKDDLNKDLQLNGNDEVVGRLLSTETYKQDFKSPPSLFK